MIQLLKNNIDFFFCESLFIGVLLISFMEYLEINLRITLLIISVLIGCIRIYKVIKKYKDE